jgi:hypothetical protein
MNFSRSQGSRFIDRAHQSATNMAAPAAFDSAFQPVGPTPEARKDQFDRGCAAGASDTESFWVAVYMLGIDEEVGTAFEQLMETHRAPAGLLNNARSANHRILGSLRNVRKAWGHDFWHQLHALRLILPTVPPVTLAASLSKLARAYRIDHAGKGLQHALQTKRSGPVTAATSTLGVRTVQNADVDVAIKSLKSVPTPHDHTGGEPASEPGREGARRQEDEQDEAEDAGGEAGRQPQGRGEAQRTRKRRKTSVLQLPSPERPRRHSRHTPTLSARSSLLLENDETLLDSPLQSTTRLRHDSSAIDPSLLSPTTFGHHFAPDDWHGIRETCTRTASQQVPRSPLTRSSTPTPRAPLPPMRGPRTPTPSPMADDEDSSGSKHSLIIWTYNELHQELDAAYTAAKDARMALEQAEEKLSQLQEQINQVTDVFPAPASSDAAADQSMPLRRLDRKISLLEQKQQSVDKQLKQYSDLVREMETNSDIFVTKPLHPEVFRSGAERNGKTLDQLRKLRGDFQEATTKVSQLRDDCTLKEGIYQNLRSLLDGMVARIKPWNPPDHETADE